MRLARVAVVAADAAARANFLDRSSRCVARRFAVIIFCIIIYTVCVYPFLLRATFCKRALCCNSADEGKERRPLGTGSSESAEIYPVADATALWWRLGAWNARRDAFLRRLSRPMVRRIPEPVLYSYHSSEKHGKTVIILS